MSRPPEDQGAPITGKAQLVEWFSSSVKPRDKWLIGTEHEGWRQLLDVLNTERIVTTAGLLGTGRRSPGIRAAAARHIEP